MIRRLRAWFFKPLDDILADEPETPLPSDLSSAVPLYDAISREFARRELEDDALAETLARWSK